MSKKLIKKEMVTKLVWEGKVVREFKLPVTLLHYKDKDNYYIECDELDIKSFANNNKVCYESFLSQLQDMKRVYGNIVAEYFQGSVDKYVEIVNKYFLK